MLKLPDDEFVSLELVHDSAHGKVDAMRETVSHLAARGVATEPPSSPDGSEDFWTAWLTDPDGYRIELVQWPAGHPDGMTHEDLQEPDAD